VTVTTPKGGKTYFFPRGTTVYINTVALGLDARTWGPDAHSFRPSRWLIDPSARPGDSTATITNIKTPARGAFLAWSTGPRSCPGMKMSQVEFVSVFMTIFGSYRCEPVRNRDDESDDEVKARFEAIIEDSQPKLTLQMMRNQDMKVKWITR
jgi:cytochrome P450